MGGVICTLFLNFARCFGSNSFHPTHNTQKSIFNTYNLMKKLLLLLTILTSCALFSSAEDVTETFVMKDQGWTEGQDLSSTTINNGSIEISFAKNDASTPTKYMNNNDVLDVRLYKPAKNKTNGGSFTVTALDGATLKSVSFLDSESSTKPKSATLSGNSATYINTTGSTVKVYSITVVYTPAEAPEPVDPVEPTAITFSLPADVDYTAPQTLEITADGHDAAGKPWPIYYNIDGEEATAADTPYTGPITIDRTMTVNACVIGAETTLHSSAAYTVTIPEPEPVAPGTDILNCENFFGSEKLSQTYAELTYTATVTYKAWMNSANTNNTDAFGIRPTTVSGTKTSQGGGIIVTASDKYAASITLTQYANQTTSRSVKIYGSAEPYTDCQLAADATFPGTELTEITLSKGQPVSYTFTADYPYIAIQPQSGACQFSEIKIEWVDKTPTAIDTITTPGADAPVEYFNLQGIRVLNPTHGIYIRRQGTTVTKVTL